MGCKEGSGLLLSLGSFWCPSGCPAHILWPPLVLGILSGDIILGLWVGNGLTDGSSLPEMVKLPHYLGRTQGSFQLVHLPPPPAASLPHGASQRGTLLRSLHP